MVNYKVSLIHIMVLLMLISQSFRALQALKRNKNSSNLGFSLTLTHFFLLVEENKHILAKVSELFIILLAN